MDTNSQQYGNNFSLTNQDHNILTENTKHVLNERHISSSHLSNKVSKPITLILITLSIKAIWYYPSVYYLIYSLFFFATTYISHQGH